MIEKVKSDIIEIMKINEAKGLKTYPEDFMQMGARSRQVLPVALQELKDEYRVEALSDGDIHSYELT